MTKKYRYHLKSVSGTLLVEINKHNVCLHVLIEDRQDEIYVDEVQWFDNYRLLSQPKSIILANPKQADGRFLPFSIESGVTVISRLPIELVEELFEFLSECGLRTDIGSLLCVVKCLDSEATWYQTGHILHVLEL